MSLLLNILAP